MKTRTNSIATGLALISLALLPVACEKAPEENTSGNDAGAALDEPIADRKLEELTIIELRAVPLGESFERARGAFILGDTEKTIGEIKIVGNFFVREAETRSGESQEALDEYGRELSKLASLLETEGSVTEEDLDEIFANAHLILALDRAANAQTAANENHREKAGENMRAAIEHSKQALRQVGKIATTEMSNVEEAIGRSASSVDAGAELAKEKIVSAANSTRDYMLGITQLVEEKIKEGKESTTRKTKEVTGEVIERTGKAVEKMGQRLEAKGSMIKPGTTDPEGNEPGR